MSPALQRLRILARLRRFALDDRPIIIGPWRSEFGFEGLYWTPFLKWALTTAKINPARCLVVSRGGAHVLYGGMAGLDLYRLRSVDDVRLENAYDYQQTQLQKQMRVTDWDRDVVAEAARQHFGRGAKYHLLHPSWMYQALAPWWDEERGMRYLFSMTDYTPMPKPPKPAGLPDKYVAMKFYGRATFPWPHPEVAAFVQQVAGSVAARTPVVLITGGPPSDEHTDIAITGANVSAMAPAAPHENLAVQAAVLAHATSFIGTYGGVAQVALRLGVPSVSFYAEWGGTAHAHRSLSEWLAHRVKTPFLVGSMADAQLWQMVMGPAVTAPAVVPTVPALPEPQLVEA